MYLKAIKILWYSFIGGTLGLTLFIIIIYFNIGNMFGEIPKLSILENPKSEIASELYSSDGQLIGKYFRENRSPVSFEELSPNLIHALQATEDARFYEHSGIDPTALGRVLVKSVIFRQGAGGGSTLSQQLAKNLFRMRQSEEFQGWLGRTKVRMIGIKAKEWITSIMIEQAYTKNEIMTMYLNTVDFGSNAFGIKVAAKSFFNTSPDSLSIQDAASLVGLLRAPTNYSPIQNPERHKQRRSVVLSQMEKYGFLTMEQYDSLVKLPVDASAFEVENHNSGVATYFRNVVRNRLMVWAKKDSLHPRDIFSEGYKIYTTIDSRMQRYAEEAVQMHMKKQQATFFKHWLGRNPWIDERHKELPGYLEMVAKRTERYIALKELYDGDSVKIARVMYKPIKMTVFSWRTPNNDLDTTLSPMDSIRYYKHFLHAGFMAMDPYNGHVKAWVGGINHKYFKYDHVEQGRRQPGSTFKPIVYATAIEEKGFHPCSKVVDAPVTFDVPGGTWTAQNSGGYSGATLTLRQAMAQSINTIAAFLIRDVTPKKVVYYAREKFAIQSPLDPVPSLSLGSADVKLIELVGAYGVFLNNGTYTEPVYITRIEDKNGNVLYNAVPQTHEAIKKETAYKMLHMLKGPLEERGGTALSLTSKKFTMGNDVGGKTGTTSNYSDGWFMGITKDFVAGTWVGADDRAVHYRSIEFGQGARMAMPVFAEFAEKVYADSLIGLTKGRFPKPKEMDFNTDCSQYHPSQNMAEGDSSQNIHIITDAKDADGEL